MSEKPKTAAQKSVAWQNRYIAPILLIIALVAVAASWAAGGVEWWFAILVLAFGAFTLVKAIQRNRR